MRTLILDLGNVIACFDHRRACRQLAALSSQEVSEDDVHAGVFGSGLERDFDCGAIDTAAFIARLRARFGLQGDDVAVARAWSDIFWPNEPMIEFVRRADASGVRLVLASNTNPLHVAQVQQQFGETLRRFAALVLSCDVGCRKPARAFFERCVAVAQAGLDDCLYVDDRADFVAAARALGVNGLVYEPGSAVPDALLAWVSATDSRAPGR